MQMSFSQLGAGRGRGSGRGLGRGGGRGRMGGPFAAGPEGSCICPNCGHKITHSAGVPCYTLRCEKCGNPMVRG